MQAGHRAQGAPERAEGVSRAFKGACSQIIAGCIENGSRGVSERLSAIIHEWGRSDA